MTQKPVVVAGRKLPEAVEARLARDYDARLNSDDKLYATDELLALCDGADAILPCHTEHLNADTIAKLPETIKAIASFSVGYDHVDTAAAMKRGIIVTNTPDVLSDATAEIAVLLMLGAARRAHEGEKYMREGLWTSWNPTFMLGTQVSGKRLGIVGMGRVGQVMAKRARGLDMEIHYYNRRRLDAGSEAGATYYDSPEKLLPHCDFLSLHCPATPETTNFLNTDRIALLPDGAIVVNTARGAIVDEPALVAALQSGKIAAAGLDVFTQEPTQNCAFKDLPNTFLLPHLGSATVETRNAMGFRALDNLDAIFAGRAPQDRVA